MIKRKDWINPKLIVKKSSTEGMGIFANEPLMKGDEVVIWKGEYTNKEGAKKAERIGKLVMQWDEDIFSVEDRGDDNGYFINHSCNPNLWMEDAFTLVAKRNIKAGEELTADYALWEADENYISKWECKCGSDLCRKRVTGKDWMLPALQERYKNHFSPLINKRISKVVQTK